MPGGKKITDVNFSGFEFSEELNKDTELLEKTKVMLSSNEEDSEDSPVDCLNAVLKTKIEEILNKTLTAKLIDNVLQVDFKDQDLNTLDENSVNFKRVNDFFNSDIVKQHIKDKNLSLQDKIKIYSLIYIHSIDYSNEDINFTLIDSVAQNAINAWFELDEVKIRLIDKYLDYKIAIVKEFKEKLFDVEELWTYIEDKDLNDITKGDFIRDANNGNCRFNITLNWNKDLADQLNNFISLYLDAMPKYSGYQASEILLYKLLTYAFDSKDKEIKLNKLTKFLNDFLNNNELDTEFLKNDIKPTEINKSLYSFKRYSQLAFTTTVLNEGFPKLKDKYFKQESMSTAVCININQNDSSDISVEASVQLNRTNPYDSYEDVLTENSVPTNNTTFTASAKIPLFNESIKDDKDYLEQQLDIVTKVTNKQVEKNNKKSIKRQVGQLYATQEMITGLFKDSGYKLSSIAPEDSDNSDTVSSLKSTAKTTAGLGMMALGAAAVVGGLVMAAAVVAVATGAVAVAGPVLGVATTIMAGVGITAGVLMGITFGLALATTAVAGAVVSAGTSLVLSGTKPKTDSILSKLASPFKFFGCGGRKDSKDDKIYAPTGQVGNNN